jgi:hypothetical protein
LRGLAAHFLLVLAVVVAVLAALATVLVATIDRTEPVPLSVEPPDGARDVSSASPIVLRFERPVDGEAVAANLEIYPPTPGTFEVDQTVVRFVPSEPLLPGTYYEVALRGGFQDRGGRVLRRTFRFVFTTR